MAVVLHARRGGMCSASVCWPFTCPLPHPCVAWVLFALPACSGESQAACSHCRDSLPSHLLPRSQL
eukprot:14233421-Alexandrium_andersonii.AAC.1